MGEHWVGVDKVTDSSLGALSAILNTHRHGAIKTVGTSSSTYLVAMDYRTGSKTQNWRELSY